jgi:hypothetical protein
MVVLKLHGRNVPDYFSVIPGGSASSWSVARLFDMADGDVAGSKAQYHRSRPSPIVQWSLRRGNGASGAHAGLQVHVGNDG